MIYPVNNPTELASASRQRETGKSVDTPLLTIFSIPKPFVRDVGLIQRNAIRSWKQMQPEIDVLLIGDDPSVAAAAAELGVRHVDRLSVNEWGTPLVSSAFEIAHQGTDSPMLVFCNCDVILLKDFYHSMRRLFESELVEFVAYGRRTDLDVDQELHFDEPQSMQLFLERCQTTGRQSSIVCKEYFAFPRALFTSIPAFAVGRGNWDNWMIHSAKQKNIPVVDVSSVVTAIHQSHDYSHTNKSRWKCYVAGPEARENERLAGGRNLISGSTPSWKMDDRGVRKIRFKGLNLSFWFDGFRFLTLMRSLLLGR